MPKINCATSLIYGACDNPTEPSNARMEGVHTLIIGLLTPDSLRTHPQEIFIGQMTPRIIGPNFPPLPKLGEDQEVNRLIIGLRNAYRGEIFGRSDAKVTIRMPSGESITLEHFKNGFYRDKTNRLKVEHLKTYGLEVLSDGKTYTGETTIPGDFRVTNLRDNDVVRVIWGAEYSAYIVNQLISRSAFAAFYRVIFKRDNDPDVGWNRSYIIANTDGALTFFFQQTPTSPMLDTITARSFYFAVDSNYARCYEPGDTLNRRMWISSDTVWSEWYRRHRWLPLQERANLRGEGRVGGVFGSYSQARITYRAVRADLRPQ